MGGDKEKKFIPSPVPVNMKPVAYDESAWGFGYNQMTIKSDWEDDFFTWEKEDIGDLKYTVHNLALGFLSSKSDVSTIEFDLLVGIIESEEDTKHYYSNGIGSDVNVEHSGDGYDIGARMVFSQTFYRQERASGGRFIDWNYALSLHMALFYLDGTFEARSIDGQFANTYDEEEWGVFVRPVVTLQPIIYLTEKLSIVPFLGLGTKITLSEYYWEDKEYVFNGYETPRDQLGDGEGFEVDVPGIGAHLGFDIGIITSTSKKHQLTIGGAISKFFGDSDADFSEIHILYAIPFR